VSAAIYDAGALVAADRNDRRFWAEHRARLELGVATLVPAAVVAQVSRSPRQAQLRRFLRSCEVTPLDERGAHAVGGALSRSKTADVADASVVVAASEARAAVIVTSDVGDIEKLVAALDLSVVVRRP
jgi:hypothetical protein